MGFKIGDVYLNRDDTRTSIVSEITDAGRRAPPRSPTTFALARHPSRASQADGPCVGER
jgi:hypothetical protein